MGQKEAARYRPTRLDPRADVVLIGMGRIAVDAPDLRLHRHVMPRYAYPPRPVDDRAPQRARRLKADEQYGRFTPAEIVAPVMTDAARLAHDSCGEDDRARQVVEPHRLSGDAHEMKGRMPEYKTEERRGGKEGVR